MNTEETYDKKIKEMLFNGNGESFGPFFAERVINQIKNLHREVEYQVFSFFKKYQLAAIGLVAALLTLNIIFSDDLSVKSILGFEENASTEIVQIDLFQDLTE
jgi:hypothetical protein